MKTSCSLCLLLTLPGQALADPLTAPSTLPNSTVGPMQTAPVAAPMPAPVWKRFPPAGTAPPASASPSAAAPATPAPVQSAPSAQRLTKRQPDSGQWVTRAPETTQAEGASVTRFVTPDLADIHRNLATRFSSLALNDTDRAELKLDASQFAQLKSAAGAQSQIARATPSHRVMGAPGSDFIISDSLKASSTRFLYTREQFCETVLKNQPRISRLLIEAPQLTPGMAFILKGACLGDRPGSVELRFANERTVQARVLDWAHDKVFVELPDITGVPPDAVQIIAITADRRMTAPRSYDFNPRWEQVSVPYRYSRIARCDFSNQAPFVRSRCFASAGEGVSVGYEMSGGLFANIHNPPAGVMGVHRYTEDDIDTASWVSGEDHWSLDLPAWAHIQSWQTSYDRLSGSKYTQVQTRLDPSGRHILAAWRMGDQGDTGFLRYRILNLRAWVPAGMRLD